MTILPGPFYYDDIFLSSNSSAKNCVPSKLDPFNPKMMSFYKAVPPVNCSSSMEWIKASPDGSVMQISSEAEKLFGPVSCQWRDVVREGDFAVSLGNVTHTGPSQDNTTLATVVMSEYVLNMSDHVFVKCRGKDGTSWDNVVTGLRGGGRKVCTYRLMASLSYCN